MDQKEQEEYYVDQNEEELEEKHDEEHDEDEYYSDVDPDYKVHPRSRFKSTRLSPKCIPAALKSVNKQTA